MTLLFEYEIDLNLLGQLEGDLGEKMLQFADLIAGKAKHNVLPGVGPGPHPHRTDHGWTWVDTGNLRRDIDVKPIKEKEFVGAFVGAWTLDYGRYLEEGFHGPSGRFYRYPWLKPALDYAIARLKGIIESPKIGIGKIKAPSIGMPGFRGIRYGRGMTL